VRCMGSVVERCVMSPSPLEGEGCSAPLHHFARKRVRGRFNLLRSRGGVLSSRRLRQIRSKIAGSIARCPRQRIVRRDLHPTSPSSGGGMRVTSVRQIGDKIVDILRSAPQPNFGPRGSRHKIYGSQSADCDDAACTGAGVRKPSMKETAMGEGWRCGVHYGDLSAAADAPEGRRSDAGRWPSRIRLTSRRLPALDAEDCWAI